MIIVHGFAPLPELASPSPFCLKLETWLRMAGLPYRAVPDFNPLTAPKGKAPWVELPDGRVLGDSSLIIDTLTEERGVSLDEAMTDDEVHRAVFAKRLVEDHLYYALLCTRWVHDEGFAILRRSYFNHLPWPAREAVVRIARRSVIRTAWAEGTARHAPEVIHRGAMEDLAALAWLIGEGPYALGPRLRTVDATVWATLANIYWGGFPGPIRDALVGNPVLVAYCERIREEVWGERGAGRARRAEAPPGGAV